jgi:hypothetical protein
VNPFESLEDSKDPQWWILSILVVPETAAMRLSTRLLLIPALTALAACTSGSNPAPANPLVRMPGTQPGQVTLDGSSPCYACHGSGNAPWVRPTPDQRGRTNYEEYNLFRAWQGSMMGNSARDPLMFACLTVAAQDSMHVLGNADAVDLCMRCHFPKGWLEGRAAVRNVSAMTGEDYDGIQCTFCHRLSDPFPRPTSEGPREGGSFLVNYDEHDSPAVPPQARSTIAAAGTFAADQDMTRTILRYSGIPFYQGLVPFSPLYDEAGGGQYFVSPAREVRGPFADVLPGATEPHSPLYSRFHKGPFICGTCHDVSNPVMANLPASGQPGDLPSEVQPSYAFGHVERTFSEYRLSAYAQPGGSPGKGNFRPNTPSRTFPVNGWETDQPGNNISKCQDCHMCSRWTPGSNDLTSPVRPEQSEEHPNTWTPCHAMTGGNVWMSEILASIAPDNATPDARNVSLLVGRAGELTCDPMQGTWTSLMPGHLPAGQRPPDITGALTLAATRNRGVLSNAASITDLAYSSTTGALTFRIQNNTGHKLISGFPEGRRMFVNVVVMQNGMKLLEVNPYDAAVGTLRGLPGSSSSPPLGPNEAFSDPLVYEVAMQSSITHEDRTFHFALATSRFKDNRIPPKGFDVTGAAERLVEPVWEGVSRPDWFTPAEYAGGYDEVSLVVPAGATDVSIRLYYQTTSREYVEFLRDEINGTGHLTLPRAAYVAQTDPFFTGLRAWGDTIFALWDHNKDRDGARPYLMAQGAWAAPTGIRSARR